MLSHLSIRNFALIERLDVALPRGLVVLTGETGAGKSIVFDAMALLVGGRAASEFIRAGADEGSVQGVFALDATVRSWVDGVLADAGVPAADELIVRRTLSRKGPNRVFLNDTVATVGLLARVLDPIVEVVGQHEHLSMVRADVHRALVDRFGHLEAAAQRVAEAFDAWDAARAARAALAGATAARAERIEFLRFQRDELEALEPRAGELEALEQTLQRARNLGKLQEGGVAAVFALIDADGSAIDRVGAALDALRRIAATDESAAPLASRLADASASLSDIAADLRRYLRGLDGDGVDVDALEARHERLRRALRKFQCDEAGLLERRAAIGVELHALEHHDDLLAAATAAERQARAAAEGAADTLEADRTQAAAAMIGEVRATLARLGMPHATLGWAHSGTRRLSRAGWDGWELLFGANPGEPVGPIAKLASGGELSRLTLAVKTVASATDRLQTYTFDEVDSGIGGAAAEIVGQLLARLAGSRQVICVTHHAQIAAFADTHFVAEKGVIDGRTRSTLRALESGDTRAAELARMLGGVELSPATRELAASMLAAGRRRA